MPVRRAAGADEPLRHARRRAVLLPAHASDASAVGVFELHREMVEDVPVRGVRAALPAAHRDRFDGMRAERPVRHVDVVDVLLDDVVAREPGEVEPVPDLPLDVRPGGLARLHPQPALVPVDFRGHEVADGAGVDPLHGGAVAGVMTPLRPRDERQTLLGGEVGGSQHRVHALRVHGDGLLHEHVLPRVDGGGEVTRPERGRRGEQHEVGVGLEHLAIRVEAREALGIVHLDLGLERRVLGGHGGQVLATPGQMVREQIAQGHELDVLARGQAVFCGAGAAAATADQSDADRFRGPAGDRRSLREGEGGRRRRRGLDECATRDISRVFGSHDGLMA